MMSESRYDVELFAYDGENANIGVSYKDGRPLLIAWYKPEEEAFHCWYPQEYAYSIRWDWTITSRQFGTAAFAVHVYDMPCVLRGLGVASETIRELMRGAAESTIADGKAATSKSYLTVRGGVDNELRGSQDSRRVAKSSRQTGGR